MDRDGLSTSVSAGEDIDRLIRPLLGVLTKLSSLEAAYFTVFLWERGEQQVRCAFPLLGCPIEEGMQLPIPADVTPESFSGVTRSPAGIRGIARESLVARRLGFKSYLSVPVTVGKHHLFGMLCGASATLQEIPESVIGMFESFAGVIGDHLIQVLMNAMEERADTAEARLDSRARFLAEAEHRLKTPLTALQGTSLTLRNHRDRLSVETRDELNESVIRNVRFLTDEVDRLLVEARADILTRELSITEIDLVPRIQAMVTAFDGISAAHHVIAEAPLRLDVLADPVAWDQTLGHVLDNALKYSPNGGAISVCAASDDGWATIEISDEGVGVPANIDVFEPFLRGAGAGDAPGVGLGLHIVRALVLSMDGSVSAEARPGGGSVFTIRLPRARHARKPATLDDQADESAASE